MGQWLRGRRTAVSTLEGIYLFLPIFPLYSTCSIFAQLGECRIIFKVIFSGGRADAEDHALEHAGRKFSSGYPS